MRRLIPILLAGSLILAGLVLASSASAAPDGARGHPRVHHYGDDGRAHPPCSPRRASLGLLQSRRQESDRPLILRRRYLVVEAAPRVVLRDCRRWRAGAEEDHRRPNAKVRGWSYRILSSDVFWEFKGATECYYWPRDGSGVGGDSVMRGRMGHFAYCPAACVQNFYPWAKVTGSLRRNVLTIWRRSALAWLAGWSGRFSSGLRFSRRSSR
jgi:hypothetical protein